MRGMWLYDWMTRLGFMNYRAKIMVMAFIGTHIPLIALASYFAFQSAPDLGTFLVTVGITLVATLIGTALTLFVLHELLRPVVATSKALRAYRETRARSDLPTRYRDEAGTLMADARLTIEHLEKVRTALEYMDETTGLPNGKRFAQSVAGRLKAAAPFHLAVMRFANFDRIADTLDADQADLAVKKLAGRLMSALGDQAALARTGKAEFSFVTETGSSGGVTAPLAALAADCSRDITLPDLTIKPEMFCGVAVSPGDAATAAKLLDLARSACAKGTAVTPVVHHSRTARQAAFELLKTEQDLRRAVERGEFTLHYQPVVDLDAGKTRGAEALVRWNHPKRGLLMPDAFIPAAEEAGLVDRLGLWVLRRTCEQIGEWGSAGRKDLKVAINVSASQFLDPDLKRHVSEAIDNARIDPRQLEIELTETTAMADHDLTRRVFGTLRDLGVTIAIDDFGTGFASMSYLRNLPFDKLKIDREFVSGVHNERGSQAICRALVALSDGLGLDVLAEGAETVEDVRYLNGLGCNLFQGYYFARPVAANEFGPAIDALTLKDVLKKMRRGGGKARRQALAS